MPILIQVRMFPIHKHPDEKPSRSSSIVFFLCGWVCLCESSRRERKKIDEDEDEEKREGKKENLHSRRPRESSFSCSGISFSSFSSIVWIIRSNSICLKSTAMAKKIVEESKKRRRRRDSYSKEKEEERDGCEQPAGKQIIKLTSREALSNLVWMSFAHLVKKMKCKKRS